MRRQTRGPQSSASHKRNKKLYAPVGEQNSGYAPRQREKQACGAAGARRWTKKDCAAIAHRKPASLSGGGRIRNSARLLERTVSCCVYVSRRIVALAFVGASGSARSRLYRGSVHSHRNFIRPRSCVSRNATEFDT